MTPDPASLKLNCPSCGRRLYKLRSGQWCAETRLLKLVAGRVLLKCDACKVDVPVPWLQLTNAPTEVPTAGRSLEVRPGSSAPAPRVGVAAVTGSAR